MPYPRLLQTSITVVLAALACLQSVAAAQQTRGDAEVASEVTSFHEALGQGDSAAVLALLAPDAVIVESSQVETRATYRTHHLPADIQFARAARVARNPSRVVREGAVAWVTTTSTITGSYEGRLVDSQGAELMVLSRETDGWRIRAIHWSSHSKTR